MAWQTMHIYYYVCLLDRGRCAGRSARGHGAHHEDAEEAPRGHVASVVTLVYTHGFSSSLKLTSETPRVRDSGILETLCMQAS